MTAMRCFHCGLINWEIGENCQHCGLSLPTGESLNLIPEQRAYDFAYSLRPEYAEHPARSAGFWFAGAGAIPAVLFVLSAGGMQTMFSPVFLLFVVAPVIIAGICGACFGSSILDPYQVQSASQAAWRGFGVAALSFLFFILFLSVLSASGSMFLLFLIYGSIIVGWLVAIVGAIAGLMLYRRRSSRIY